jgi:serine/threonine protein kinase
MEAYEVVRQLGKGGMGTAYCVRKRDGISGFLALKQVACNNINEGNDALREAKMLQVIHTPMGSDVHKAHRAWHLCVCVCVGGDLHSYIVCAPSQVLSHKNVVRYHDVFLHMDSGLLQVCHAFNFRN